MTLHQKRDRIIEVAAVTASLLYTYLYLKENPLLFVFGILGPLLFFFLAWKKKIYADAGLQVFYVAVTIYGLIKFIYGGGEWKKNTWELNTHLLFILPGIIATFSMGYLLRKKTDAKLPYFDSFTTVFAVIGTWMMMNFVHENWLYFIVVNIASIILFLMRKLYIGSIMFGIYLAMAIDGYFELNIFSQW